MLVLKNISLHFGERTLFSDLNWTIKPGEKLVLIGRNGVGKTTLFKLMTGQLTPDSGDISSAKNAKIGLLEQDLGVFEGHTVRSLAMSAFPEVAQHAEQWRSLETRMNNAGSDEEMMKLSSQMSDLADEMNIIGAHQKSALAEKVLKGLGFTDDDMDRSVDTFSGGWQMRILLARLLLIEPEFLLLDEPTNHLDIVSVIWLENYLREYPGAYVVISHDKRFLNKVADRVAEIESGKIRTYAGNYDDYLRQKEEQKEILLNTYKNQQAEIERKEKLIDKFRAKASKASTAKALASELERMDRVELEPDDARTMNIRFPDAPRSAERVIETEDLGMRYGKNRVFSGIDFNILRGQKVSLIGQNGQGKSTMAKIIAGKLKPTEGGVSIGSNVILKYFAQDQGDQIDTDKTVLEWLEDQASPEMQKKVRHILGAFLFSQDDVDKKVKVLSGGEKSRLALAALVLQPMNFLLLDEPTNHLDMQSKEVLKSALKNYDGAMLVISHDRDFLTGLTENTAIIHDGRLSTHLGDVDSFLRQKGFDSIVEFSLSGDKPRASESAGKDNKIRRDQDRELKKTQERKLKKVEKRIEELERRLKELEAVMAEAGFFEGEKKDDVLDKYQKAKSELEESNEIWEELVTQMS
ncbi:MAG: ABC-F family ATP-binding cassette domain-containing protein [Saprospiraceae bacterium]|nr:ABC-F family ATP-binding cassette domain-containing protein [Saprospiraceae bacterium]